MAETQAVTEREFRFLGEMGRYDAFLYLYHSQEPAESLLLKAMLESKDPLVPLILLQYLEEMPERRAVQPMLRLIEDGNDVVARAAMAAYKRNHYPGKARLLKALILSRNERGCRFAVRVLSRAGLMDALPLIVREMPDREGAVKVEMIEALRFLPDSRSVPVLLPLVSSTDEKMRFLAVQVLSELQLRERVLSPEFFLKRATDESERVRRVALEALQRLPTRRVARMFLAQALDPKEPEAVRERAIRALGAFPSRDWVEPLVRLLAGDEAPTIKLSAEIALRALSDDTRSKGLLPLLRSAAPALRRHAAQLLAESHGREPHIRALLLELWTNADAEDQLDLIDMLRELGGEEAAGLLLDATLRSPLVAYSAAEALTRLLGPKSGPRVLGLLRDAATPHLTKQALLNHWTKRGPNDALRAELFPWLVAALGDPVMNIRYLSLQILGWYPIADTLRPILDLLERETTPDVVRTAYRILLKGLGRDPMPLVRALAEHQDREALRGHAVKLLISQAWDEARVFDLLHGLATPPLSFPSEAPEAFFSVCVHLMERGGVTLEKIWLFLEDEALQRRFLHILISFMRNPQRRFLPLPLFFLTFHLADADTETKGLFFELLELDRRPESADALAAALLRERDPACLKLGADCLRRMVMEVEA